MSACVYCGYEFAPTVTPPPFPRTKCPKCRKTNGVISWDTATGKEYKLIRWAREKDHRNKKTLTLSLSADVRAALMEREGYSPLADEILREGLEKRGVL